MFWLFVVFKAAVATGIGLFATLAFRHNRSPQVAFSVWLGILVVLMLPPLLSVPVWHSSDLAATQSQSQSQSEVFTQHPLQHDSKDVGSKHLDTDSSIQILSDSVPNVNSSASPDNNPEPAQTKQISNAHGAANSVTWSTFQISRSFLKFMGFALMLIWIIGACRVASRYVFEIRTIANLLEFAEPVSTPLSLALASIGKEAKLKEVPDLVMVNGRVSPFLWHPLFGSAKIVVPKTLVESLSERAWEVVLRHELKHFQRRDAHRRFFEMLVASIWWWLPTIWTARKHLRRLEELLTDAEVIRSSDISRKAYASVLLDTEELLAAGRHYSPEFAPTFTEYPLLRTRVELITNLRECDFGKTKFRCLTLGVWAVLVPVGLMTAGVARQDSDTRNSRTEETRIAPGPPVAPVVSADAVRSNATSQRRRRRIRQAKPSIANAHLREHKGEAGSFVRVANEGDSKVVTLIRDGVRRKAAIRRNGETNDGLRIWDLVSYDSSIANEADSDFAWLFSGLRLDCIINYDGRQIRHSDLPLLARLTGEAATGNIAELLEAATDLVSSDARGQITALVASREDLDESQQVALLKLLKRDDHKVSFSVCEIWQSFATTVDTLQTRDDLTDEARTLINQISFFRRLDTANP